MHPYPLPRTGAWASYIVEFLHTHAYLSQLRIKCGTVTICALVYLTPCCLFHHTNIILFLGLFLILNYPTYIIFLFRIWLPCREGNENSQWGNLHIQLVPIPVSYAYLPSPRPIPSPYMGSSVGVLLTRYR